MNPDQQDFNPDQGQILYQRVFKTPTKPRSAVTLAGLYFGRRMAWFKRFIDPIILADGPKLLTFRDAAKYITDLANSEHDAQEWQRAIQR